MMENWRNVHFSIASGPLTAADRERLGRVKAHWVLINTRQGRHYIDMIGPIPQLQAIQDELVAMGRDPIVIGIFDHLGVLRNTPNKPEWVKVAQDVVTYNAQGQELTRTRPTAFIQTHKWAGWGDKVVP